MHVLNELVSIDIINEYIILNNYTELLKHLKELANNIVKSMDPLNIKNIKYGVHLIIGIHHQVSYFGH